MEMGGFLLRTFTDVRAPSFKTLAIWFLDDIELEKISTSPYPEYLQERGLEYDLFRGKGYIVWESSNPQFKTWCHQRLWGGYGLRCQG